MTLRVAPKGSDVYLQWPVAERCGALCKDVHSILTHAIPRAYLENLQNPHSFHAENIEPGVKHATFRFFWSLLPACGYILKCDWFDSLQCDVCFYVLMNCFTDCLSCIVFPWWLTSAFALTHTFDELSYYIYIYIYLRAKAKTGRWMHYFTFQSFSYLSLNVDLKNEVHVRLMKLQRMNERVKKCGSWKQSSLNIIKYLCLACVASSVPCL